MGIRLHDVSPLAAMATGKGAMGKLMAQGVGGVIPAAIARDAIRQRAAEEAAKNAKAASVGSVGSVAKPMKNGGSASSRADGCAMRGKTKGKMV
jgi:hypothetical protein